MTTNTPVKVRRFFGARALSLLFKVGAFATVLLTVGALGYALVEYIGLPLALRTANPRESGLWQMYNYMLGLLAVGGISALFFFTLSKILEMLIAINESLHALARRDTTQLASDKGLHSSNLELAHRIEKLTEAVGRQERLTRLALQPEEQQRTQSQGE